MTRFSSRLPADLAPTPLARALEAARASGRPLVDLTESNPTRAGLQYPDLSAAFADVDFVAYEPDARGLRPAREAVAADYARRGVRASIDRMLLTASSSESYAFVFKTFCDPGDSVLVPVPSYPLFDHLAALEGVRLLSYRLERHGAWRIDVDDLARRLEPRTRALLVVSPNNPTGSWLRRGELDALADLCARHDLVLVGDEVFADYPVAPPADAVRSVLEQERALAIALGGLSKSAGLPHVKLGWMALGGPPLLADQAAERLELVADTYLSVSSLVQRAAPRLLALGATVRSQIADRVLLNERVLRARGAASPSCEVLPIEGGWTAVVRVPAVHTDEEWTLALAAAGVLVHPGFFFDFDREGYLVVSLLVKPDEFARAVTLLFERIDRA